jgi:hypothetical protein
MAARHPALNHPTARGCGYPVHRVVSSNEWTSPHDVSFTDYVAACGLAETRQGAGWNSPLCDPLRVARAAEMCKTCWAPA